MLIYNKLINIIKKDDFILLIIFENIMTEIVEIKNAANLGVT